MKLTVAGTRNRATQDTKGDVRIQLVRADKGKNVAGNITKSITVQGVKVSELYTWLEEQIAATAK